MSDRAWRVACPLVNHFEECRVIARSPVSGRITIKVDGELHGADTTEYDRCADLHALKHEEQRAKFKAAAPVPWLGEAMFWYSYVRGYFKFGAFRNPLEAEARRAEDRKPTDV